MTATAADQWAWAAAWPQVHDIDNAEAFVTATIHRSGLILTPTERDDLHADGLAIIKELALAFDGRGSFAGYAARYLPRRMQDAHRARHPEHRRRTVDGRRVREWGPAPVSLHAPDAPTIATSAVDQTLDAHEHADTDPTRLPLVASAMSLLPSHDRLLAWPVIDRLYDGLEVDQIARTMPGVTRGDVVRIRDAFQTAVRQAQHDAQEAEAA